MIAERIRAVFAEVFQVDPQSVKMTSSPADVSGWDSFGHLALVDALQHAFKIAFETEDIAQMDTVASIESILLRRGARP